jgi:hypothetical protein
MNNGNAHDQEESAMDAPMRPGTDARLDRERV